MMTTNFMKMFRKKHQIEQDQNKGSKDLELKKLAQLSDEELFAKLKVTSAGMTSEQAEEKFEEFGPNEVAAQQPTPWYMLLFEAFQDPFIYVLLLLCIVSFVTKDIEAATVMIVMVVLSAGIRFVQEYRSQKASLALKELIETTTAVLRDGEKREIPIDEVVPGDIISLSTGDMIPADMRLLSTKDLFINQSSLTGESLPVEKFNTPYKAGTDATDLSALEMQNLTFMGTDVLSGQATGVVLKTGDDTFFGDIASHVSKKRAETGFDRGVKSVSALLIKFMVVMVPIVFLINGFTKGDWVQAFFFAVAIAVGLTPEMLPMIVTTNLAKGAISMSKKKVIVKELNAIQNMGAIDILCTDKTGTITEDEVVLVKHVDSQGLTSETVLDLAYMNSYYQTGWKNLMDHAVLKFYDKEGYVQGKKIEKIDEIPFDFSRRRLTVIVEVDGHHKMITKGAVEEMFAVCRYVEIDGETVPLTDELKEKMQQISIDMNEEGMRVIGIAYKNDVHSEATYSVNDEKEMTLVGFMGFLDPAKKTAITAIKSLHQHGVSVKVLTGDNDVVSRKVCKDVGIEVGEVLLGSQIEKMSDEALSEVVEEINLFAKLNPTQKSRIIELLQKKDHIVGFMGDGINDASALRKADVGISVDTAADITKEASSIILLEKSLNVLEAGLIEGRKVFGNILKYIKMTASSNFGNVFSVLVASAFLPFLPMLSIQLLVQNLIYDVAQLCIPWDSVDEEMLEKPRKWKTDNMNKFMVIIGPISSIFDILTYLLMWFVFDANTPAKAALFHSGWFVIGLITQTLVVHVIRTEKIPFIQSRASWPVMLSTIIVIAIAVFLPGSFLGGMIDMVSLPGTYWFWMVGIVTAYVLTAQLVKTIYIKKTGEWL